MGGRSGLDYASGCKMDYNDDTNYAIQKAACMRGAGVD